MIDIRKGSHVSSFPSKVASMMGKYGHVYNIILDANADNGKLVGRGAYVSFDQYEEDTLPTGWTGKVLEKGADGRWLVETTVLPSTGEVLYIYNDPVSEYGERDFQDESLFYNKAGEVAQGATLIVGDVVAVSENGFNQTPTAGDSVTFVNGVYTI